MPYLDDSVQSGLFDEPRPDYVAYCERYGCGRGVEDWNDVQTADGGSEVCTRCADMHYVQCSQWGCETLIDCGEYCSDCWSEGDDYDEDDDGYGSCIHDYSYVPSPRFHGQGPLFLGIELEVSAPWGRMSDTARIAQEYLGDLGYLKSDGSLEYGFEMVTHPMSHQWARDNFPWRMLGNLRREGCEASQDAGLHIHVSRDAFADPVHVFRWLKLLYRNEEAVTVVARRRSDDWAPWNPDDRERGKDYAKGERSAGRYAAVNVTNWATFELRIFASTLRKSELSAAMDLAAASIEYTRSLTVPQIVAGAWDWDSFMAWVDERPEYAALAATGDASCKAAELGRPFELARREELVQIKKSRAEQAERDRIYLQQRRARREELLRQQAAANAEEDRLYERRTAQRRAENQFAEAQVDVWAMREQGRSNRELRDEGWMCGCGLPGCELNLQPPVV